jgi:ubiquinone biosynthesis monooxygenase Coq7
MTGIPRQPGDLSPRQLIDRIIRVDQAGEYGAVRIYQGQLAVLRRMQSAPGKKRRAESAAAQAIAKMEAQERAHLETFNSLMVERRARPTLLRPLWHVAGYALGAATALLGENTAMAATVAIEDVIETHYAKQSESLGAAEPELKGKIDEFRTDELAHRDEALASGAEQAAFRSGLSAAIKIGSKLAIWLSERL